VNRSRRGLFAQSRLLLVALVVFLCSAVPVLADDPNEQIPPAIAVPEGSVALEVGGPPNGPNHEEMVEIFQRTKHEEEELEEELASPAAVKERENSLRAFVDLSPAQAEELLAANFPDFLASLNSDPARTLSDSRLDRNLGEGDAVVTSEGKTQLLEGSYPVETQNDDGELEKVDVSLEETAEGYEAENPLVEVAIADSAKEGVVIGGEGSAGELPPISVTQVGARESTARVLGDKNAFFGEVEPGSDTDLLVSPTAYGVEFANLLRTVDSPETLRFHVDLPVGTELRAEQGGGAEVVAADGSLLYRVDRPVSFDAQGSRVPTTLEVEGENLVLEVPHQEADVAYPILVDPELEMNWSYGNIPGIAPNGPWYPYVSASGNGIPYGTSDNYWPNQPGLYFAAQQGSLGANIWTELAYFPPNEKSYIAKAVINIFHRGDFCSPLVKDPYDFTGMYTWNNGGTPETPHWNGYRNNDAYNWGNATINSWGNEFIIGYGNAIARWNPCWRNVRVGGTQIWLDDWQYPYLDFVGATPEGWLKKDATSRTFNVSASDAGLGVRTVRMFGVGTQNWPWSKGSCLGTYENRCNNFESGQISFTTNGFPYEGRYNGEGVERKFTVQVEDPTQKTWQLQRPIWLDGTAPSVSLSGQLATITDQVGATEKPQNGPSDKDELSLPTYKLQIATDDGADRSGVQEIKVYLDKDPSKEPGAVPTATKSAGSCPTAGCARTLNMEYMLRLPGLAAGKHSLFIVAVDKVGNVSPLERNVEFEYFPATGMKDEYVMQHFRLPDGNDYSGEAEYHGPEIAVNVINGNVVFHQRDVDVDTDRAEIELERVYNSQQPSKQDTQWGRGWEISQAPAFEPEQTPAQTATMQRRGAITSAVPVPQATGQEVFSARLRATVTKTAGGYEVEPVEANEVTAFDTNGRIQEVVLGDDTPVYLEPRTEEELELLAPGAPTYAGVFGSAGTGNGQFGHPAGIAVDSKGTIWVVDQENERVQKFNAAGEFQSAFGSSGTGNGQFGRPTDIAVDAFGNLWVTDAGNSRVEKFNEKGEFLAKFGSYGSGNGQFNAAESIAIDRQGNIWIGDTYNGRLQKFNSAFEFIKVIGSKGSGTGQMIEPTGIDIGLGGDVWVADWGNNRVSVFNSNGEFVRQFGSSGTGNGQFARPDVIEVDSRGNVWVGDQNNGRVQQFDQVGKYVDQFGTKGSGQGQFSFGWPMGIASDTKGNLWVSDTGNNRVQRWQIPAYVPSYDSTFGSSCTGNSQFNHPADVAVDSQGNLWVADKFNHRIQKFNSKGEFVAKYGSSGTGAGQLSGPSSIAFDAAGNFWVAERNNNRLQKFSSSGESLKTVGNSGSGNGQFSGPEGIAIAPNGHIFVSDTYNYRVQEFNANGEFIKVVNPAGLGAIEPTGITADANGDVWVTDWSNNRVVELSEAGTLIRSFGSTGTGDGQFNRPDAVEVDAQGKVWIGDQNNGRIQIFNQNAEFVTKFGVSGSGEGQFSFSYPFGFAVTATGTAWIADANNNRVQRWKTAAILLGGEEEKVLAPTFGPPVLDYEYENGKLEAMQLEDEATEGVDPELDLNLTGNQVTEVESEEAGNTSYEYESNKLKAADGPEGETKFGYDGSSRLTSVTLPNGTTATITYDETSRATSVKVDPAGPEAAKTTNLSYQAEPRRTIVWGDGNPEITYDIGEDGSVLKWAWAETPPTIASISGSLWSKQGQELENKDQTLFVTGSSPHQIASIKVVVTGNSVVEEKTCEDPVSPPSHVCDQPAPLEWITHPSEHAAGRMDVEVLVTDFLGHQTAERFFVIVPQQPSPDPTLAERPNFKAIKAFRETHGLDRNNPRTEQQMNELVLELLYEWEGRNPTAMAAVEAFGSPMRAPELAEMEYRRQYINNAADVIPEWAEEHAANIYGGSYVDDRAGGLIYVGFTENQAALVKALKGDSRLINPGAIREFPTPPTVSIASLETSSDSVIAALDGNSPMAQLTTSVHVSPQSRMIEVGATDPAAVQQFLSTVFGTGAPIKVQQEAKYQNSASRYGTSGPIVGGAGIIHGGAICTAGYGSRTKTGESQGQPLYTYFTTTAGHCYDFGDDIHREERKFASGPGIGTVRRDAAPAGQRHVTDALAIRIADSLRSHSVLNGVPLEAQPIQGVQRVKTNKEVCWSGIFGGKECGTVRFATTGFIEHEVKRVFIVEGWSMSGDSGGPVWDPNTHKAVGIISFGLPAVELPCYITSYDAKACPGTAITPLLQGGGSNGVNPVLGIETLKQG